MSEPKQFYAGTSDEYFPVGPCASYEDAVAEGKEELADELAESGNELVIGRGRDVYATIDGHNIIEQLGDTLYVELYEDAVSEWCIDIPKDQYAVLSERLTATLQTWLKEQNEAYFWTTIEPLVKTEAAGGAGEDK